MKSAILSLLLLTKQSISSDWDYEDMASWSDHYTMCDNGDESPIDIAPLSAVYNFDICNPFFDWDIDTRITSFKVTNNGHSISLNPVEASSIDPDGELASTLFDSEGAEYQVLATNEDTIGRFPNYFQPSDSPHDEFCLDSFHFHWGLTDETGSEHFVDGNQYALEVHFVHYSCEHASLGVTLTQFPNEGNVTAYESDGSDSHQLGVVAIFFDVFDDYVNPAFEAMLTDDILETVAVPGHDITLAHGLDLEALIPENIKTDGYYAYQGSLTTPPCTDIVRWHVMNAHGKIGTAQMEKFRELYAEESESAQIAQIAPNYRDIQQNENTVYGCMDATDMSESEEEESDM